MLCHSESAVVHQFRHEYTAIYAHFPRLPSSLFFSLSTIPIPPDSDSPPSVDRPFVTESRVCQFTARVASQLVENIHTLLARSCIDKIVHCLDKINLLLTLGDDEGSHDAEGCSQVSRLSLQL